MAKCSFVIRFHDVVILVAASITRLMVNGPWFTPGILFVAFKEGFQYSAGVTSWITSLQYFISCLSCAVNGWLIKRWGSRVVGMLGGVVMSAGLLTSMFASHIAHIFITYGIVSGIGSGMAYIGVMEAINVQFNKHRNILFGVCAFAGNIGIVIYAPMMQTLLNLYTWTGLFLILGALSLNIIPFSITFPKNQQVAKKDVSEQVEGLSEVNKNKDIEDDRVSESLLRKYSDDITRDPLEGDRLQTQDIYLLEIDKTSKSGSIAKTHLEAEGKHSFADNGQPVIEKCENSSRGDSMINESEIMLPVFKEDISAKKENQPIQENNTENRHCHCYSFMKNTHYYLYVFSGMLFMFGSAIVIGHLSAYMLFKELTDKMGASTLYTVHAVFMATGKLVHGVIITGNRIQPLTLHIFLTLLGGILTIIFVFDVPFPVFYVYIALFGVCNAGIGGSLLPAIILQMSGLEDFAFALGLHACVTSIGYLIGAPIAGWVFDVTNSYTGPFLMAAIAMTSSSFVMIFSRCAINRKAHKKTLGNN